jgi:hypothetical protein
MPIGVQQEHKNKITFQKNGKRKCIALFACGPSSTGTFSKKQKPWGIFFEDTNDKINDEDTLI